MTPLLGILEKLDNQTCFLAEGQAILKYIFSPNIVTLIGSGNDRTVINGSMISKKYTFSSVVEPEPEPSEP